MGMATAAIFDDTCGNLNKIINSTPGNKVFESKTETAAWLSPFYFIFVTPAPTAGAVLRAARAECFAIEAADH